MDNYNTLITKLADSDAAEEFLTITYGMSPFQAWGFISQVTSGEITQVELAYTMGAMDAHIGNAKSITNQLQSYVAP
jgi:hypothetical protein